MSKFFEELWESIFTPGPTPSLLIATNVTFAVLQVVLFALLLATYSIHFIILSFLSGGLWWAINWFARELQVARDEKEEEQKRTQRRRAVVAAATASRVSTDSETEVEESSSTTAAASKGQSTGQQSRGGGGDVRQRPTGGATSAAARTGAAQVEAETDGSGAAPAISPPTTLGNTEAPGSQGASQRSSSNSQRLSSSRSGVSTEDEWEKVSENEKEQ